jgi:hypothetical protein
LYAQKQLASDYTPGTWGVLSKQIQNICRRAYVRQFKNLHYFFTLKARLQTLTRLLGHIEQRDRATQSDEFLRPVQVDRLRQFDWSQPINKLADQDAYRVKRDLKYHELLRMRDHLQVELSRLDINNTIDHHVSGDRFQPSKFVREILDVKVEDLYRMAGCSYQGEKDTAARLLAKMTKNTRSGMYKARFRFAVEWAASNGWFVVFDTLTIADGRAKDFAANKNAMRDHFRRIGRQVLEAEGRSKKETFNDCFRYFAVPEFGSKNGRFHYHCVYLMRTLPRGQMDPGRVKRTYRELRTLKHWNYGFSAPIAVRFHNDAFTRAGWVWPLTKLGDPIPCKPLAAVSNYCAKYINKEEEIPCHKKRTYRIRTTRGLGMEYLAMMQALPVAAQMELAQIHGKNLPGAQVIRHLAKISLVKKLAGLSIKTFLDQETPTPNILQSLRTLIQQTPNLKMLNAIQLQTPRLKRTDISEPAEAFLVEIDRIRNARINLVGK